MRLLGLFVGVYMMVVLVKCQDVGPGPVVTPEKLTRFVGTNAEFQCTVTQQASVQIQWFTIKEQREVLIDSSTPGFKIIQPTNCSENKVCSKLVILDVTAEDDGSYICKYGSDSQGNGLLIVTYEGVVEIIGNRIIKEGTDMNFTCLVDGSTAYEVTWSKENVKLPNDNMPQFEIKGTELIIKNVNMRRDHGNLTCSSSLNDTAVSSRITIGGAVRIKAHKSVKFTEGERASFECLTLFPEDSDPTPTYTWVISNQTSNITLTKSEGRFEISLPKFGKPGSVLHMVDVVFDDAGNYTCIAESPITTVEHTTQLRVRDRLAALWPFIGIMSEVIILIIIIFIHEKCTQGDDIGEEDEDEDQAEPIKEKEKISLDGEGDMRMRSNKP